MSVLNNAAVLLLGAEAGGGGGYEISRSLRFNSSDSAYLSRTPASAGNRKTWTWAGWVKRSALGDYRFFCGWSGSGASAGQDWGTHFSFQGGNRLYLETYIGSHTMYLATSQVFRDVSAWFHLVVAFDTTQATASDRVKIYINGTQVTAFDATTYPTQNSDHYVNSTNIHTIGVGVGNDSATLFDYFSGYLADIHFIDGQALTPSSFTEVSATTGQLIPKAYTGTFTGNSFWLKFADNSAATATTLGKDSSGLGNNWTPNNLSVITGGPTSVAAASGALPIYNTTDTYGAVKGTGTRTDSNSSSIVLAVPMDGTNGGTSFSDQSATIKGSGSAKTITVNGATTSTAQSKYYGSSATFNGSSNLSVASTTDFDFSSINYTIELWFYADSTTISPHSRLFEFSSTVFAAYIYSDRSLYVKGGNAGASGDISFPAGSYFSNQWNHLAVVGYSDGTRTALLNGVLKSTTGGGNPSGAQSLSINGDTSGSYRWTGYVSDFRVYRGVAKYTGNFNPPSSTQNPTIAAGNDSLVDTPTSYGTDTGAGGEVRGNYATLNPLAKGSAITLANGNLDWSESASDAKVLGTIGMSSGKWYWEVTCTATNQHMGLATQAANLNAAVGYDAFSWSYGSSSGQKVTNSSGSAYGATYTTGDVIGVAFDADNGTLTFYKNGTSQGQAFSGLTSGPYFAAVGNASTSGSINFGQRPFAYQTAGTNRPASTYLALCDQNLPTPVVAKSASTFDVKLYTGNGSTQTISGLGFSPDLVWIKRRNAAASHMLYDTVRTLGYPLTSDATTAEPSSTTGMLTAFQSDGFTVAVAGGNNSTNGTSDSYVAWTWDAGTTTASNPDGSITTSLRASPSSGFSVVSWSGVNGANGTIGHGLGVAPQFVILKNRGTTDNWRVYHVSVGATGFLQLASTGATVTSDEFQNTSPTSTVFYLRGNTWNAASNNYIAYCFAPVAGFSSFGSYTGNGSADGPFVYTGHRPRWILLKATSIANESWIIIDTARSTYNVVDAFLRADTSGAEFSSSLRYVDILSNGFKLRASGTEVNGSGTTYVYASFAESPFQYARAR